MKKSSINFKAVTSYSEEHNQRQKVPDYVIEGNDKIPNNVAIVQDSIANRFKEIKQIYSEKIKQKWQTQTTPIKEAVIVLDEKCFMNAEGNETPTAAIEKLNKLNDILFDRYGIKAFQTYIHFDEGKKTPHGEVLPLWERNIHAHVLYDFQLKSPRTIKKKKKNGDFEIITRKAGQMTQLTREELSDIQTITAETLGLQRGVLGSKSERLEHGEYREKMQELNLNIETTKNELRQLQEELERKKLRTSNLTEELKKWNMKSKIVQSQYEINLKEVNELLKSSPILKKYWSENKTKYQTLQTL